MYTTCVTSVRRPIFHYFQKKYKYYLGDPECRSLLGSCFSAGAQSTLDSNSASIDLSDWNLLAPSIAGRDGNCMVK